eukprot:7085790-Karenia_brevis.AAC.1
MWIFTSGDKKPSSLQLEHSAMIALMGHRTAMGRVSVVCRLLLEAWPSAYFASSCDGVSASAESPGSGKVFTCQHI